MVGKNKPASSPSDVPSPVCAFIISHSHFDREWYLPFALFRNKLVILMDYLADIFATEPTFSKFVADCQVAMIDDYLEVKPQAAEWVKKALVAGQLLAGPYFVPPNEYLINGEGYVRNILLARRILKKLGLKEPNCTAGYSPDSACSDFGHPIQVPQMWALLGLRSFVARGLGPMAAGKGFPSDFWWESPDGSRVHVVSIVSGYSTVADLSENVENGAKTLIKVATDLAPRYLTSNILLFNGNDHLLPQKHIGHLITRANALQKQIQFLQSSYEDYASAVESTGAEMPTYRGEFMERGGREQEGKLRKVNGYFSTRIYLKQANARCEQILSHHSEALSTLAWIVGGHEYPADYLWEAWRWVVRNHHHDSVPGTSTDTVHRECRQRYEWAEQMGTGIAVKKLNELAQHIPGIPPGLEENNQHENAFLVAFNPHAWPYRGPITFDLMDNWIYCTEPSVRLIPLCMAMTQFPPSAFHVEDATGNAYTVVKEPILGDTGYKFSTAVQNLLLSFVAELPAFGYKVFQLHPAVYPAPPASDLLVDTVNNVMENQFLNVKVNPAGTITLTDKVNGQQYPDILEFVDYGDRGDEYDQAPVRDGEGWSQISSRAVTPEIAWIETATPRGRVDITYGFQLPKRYVEENRVDTSVTEDLTITASIRLFEHTEWVDFQITILNHAENHRVEVRVPTGIPAKNVQVDGAFCTTTRPLHFYQTAAMHRFLDVNDGKAGLAILSRGIYEYNLDKDPKGGVIVDLTLLRCVGVLAGHHIGNNWPANATPDAQVPGVTIVEFALVSHDWDAIKGKVHRRAAEFCAPPRAIEPLEHLYLRGKCPKTLPAAEHSFVSLNPSQLALTTFFKDDVKEVAYLRFYNAVDRVCEAKLEVDFGKPVKDVTLVDLKGDFLPDQQSLRFVANIITLQVRPLQIVTLALKVSLIV